MKTGLIIAVVIIAVLIIGGIYLTTDQGGNNSGSLGNNKNKGNVEENTAGEISETPQTYNAEIRDFAYLPKEIKIKKGDKVVWINFDNVRHTVTSDSGSELDSELLSDGETYSHTFNTDGTYSYYCKPHPYMKGKVIVE